MPLTITPYDDYFRDELLELWAKALPLDAITADILESRVLLDDNFDPETFLLARDHGQLVGFVLGVRAMRLPLGDADPSGTRSWITALGVGPEFSLATIGGRLLDEVEVRFRALGQKECFVSPYPPGYFTPGIDQKSYKPILDLFLSKGYEALQEAISMDASIVLFTISSELEVKERKLLKEEIEIRPYSREDLTKFLSFMEKSMPTDWVRVARRNLRKIPEGSFKPEQITLATKGGKIIGYCQYEGSHFGPFGVSTEYQGMGIGTILLARTLQRMRREGYHNAWVMWTDDTAAKVYRKFGFAETRRFSILKKVL